MYYIGSLGCLTQYLIIPRATMSGGEATAMPVVIVTITVFAFDRLMISGLNQLLTASKAGPWGYFCIKLPCILLLYISVVASAE